MNQEANIDTHDKKFLKGFANNVEMNKFILFDTMNSGLFKDSWVSFGQLCRAAFGSRTNISNMESVREALNELVESKCLIERRGQYSVVIVNPPTD